MNVTQLFSVTANMTPHGILTIFWQFPDSFSAIFGVLSGLTTGVPRTVIKIPHTLAGGLLSGRAAGPGLTC